MEFNWDTFENRLHSNVFHAWSEAFRTTYLLLRITAIRICGRRTPAGIIEGLIHDALIAAMQKIDDFRNESTKQTWMVAILRNKCYDHRRRLSRSPCVQLTDYHCKTIVAKEPEVPESHVQTAILPIVLDELIAREAPGRVRRRTLEFIRQLYLERAEIPSIKEMAELWNCTPGTAKVRWHDARKLVRIAIEKEMRQME